MDEALDAETEAGIDAANEPTRLETNHLELEFMLTVEDDVRV